MRIDCCAACGGGRHNAPTRSPTSQAHTYRRACAPLRHVAPLGRTAHSVALYSRQRNGTPAATVRRSWLSCQSQSECVPFANFAKNSEIFRNCAEIRKEKKKSTISENLFFAEICPPLPRFAGAPSWSLLLLRSTLLALRPSLRRPYRQKMNTYRYSFSSFCFCGFASLAMLAHAAVAAGGRAPCSALPQCSPPVFLWLQIVYVRLAVCRFRVVSRRPRGGAQKPVSGIHYGSVFAFPLARRHSANVTTKNFFCQITRLQDTTKIAQIMIKLLDGWI